MFAVQFSTNDESLSCHGNKAGEKLLELVGEEWSDQWCHIGHKQVPKHGL